MTDAFHARQKARAASGRYRAHKCSCGCGKPAPLHDYFSDPRHRGGFGLVLREDCAERLASLSDEAFAAAAAAADGR